MSDPNDRDPETKADKASARSVQYQVDVSRIGDELVFSLQGEEPWTLAAGPAAGEYGELGSLLEALSDAVTEDFDL